VTGYIRTGTGVKETKSKIFSDVLVTILENLQTKMTHILRTDILQKHVGPYMLAHRGQKYHL
jgi:hypothetical protein